MAGIAAVLGAVARAQWRDLRSLGSIAGNNFFLFMLLLMQDPASAAFFGVLIGALVLFPMSADPLRTVPRDRLALWPLSSRQVVVLRIASLGLSPIVWIMALLMLRTARLRSVLELALIAGCIQAVLLVSRAWTRGLPQWNILRLVPAFRGYTGALVLKDVRQMLCTLDFYLAGLLAAAGVTYRALARPADAAAIPMMALLVVLALSTYAQCLFGLDGASGLMRYRLLPMRGWRILIAKDVAWLLVLAPLVVALSPLAGLTGGFVALAVGHHASLRRPLPQQRWRFTTGLLPVGLAQSAALFAAGTAVDRFGPWWMAGSMAVWIASVLLYGFLWDSRRNG